MRFSIFLIFLWSFNGLSLKGQDSIEKKEGTVSFITSQNVYVKFESTTAISVGDTLFYIQNTQTIPVLMVNVLSSISCVCSPIGSKKLSVNDKLIAIPKNKKKTDYIPVIPATIIENEKLKTDSTSNNTSSSNALKQNIYGRFSLSSYSNISNVSDNSLRLRYTLALNAQNIANSKLSTETYLSFAHKMNEWSEIQNNIYNGLKIYSLAANYAFNTKHSIWLGRKINQKISNIGAIDGLQYDYSNKWLSSGIFVGTRPDYVDYSFNANLLQFGGYIGHDYKSQQGMMQSSIAFVEQMNNGNTDRRFVYFQHSNSLLKNLYFFGSVEFDLYNKVLNSLDSTLTQDNTPNLSNLYVSVRYRVIKQLSLSLSYSNRENIVYYETYKNIIDKLLDVTKMQGYMFQLNYSPVNKLSLGANAGYRFSEQDPKSSKNLYTYLTYSNVPWINASATLSATLMQTSYINGKIYSLGFSRDLLPGKVYGGLNYRFVDYNFVSNETPLIQNMGEIYITWRLLKKLSLSINCEGTFEKEANFESIYFNITQRF